MCRGWGRKAQAKINLRNSCKARVRAAHGDQPVGPGAGLKAVGGLIDRGILIGPAVPYVTNTLTIMVPASNPRGTSPVSPISDGLTFIWRCRIPRVKGVARQIEASLNTAADVSRQEGATTVEVHGGELSVSPDNPRGAMFRFVLHTDTATVRRGRTG